MNEGLELRNYGKEGKNTPISSGMSKGGVYVFAQKGRDGNQWNSTCRNPLLDNGCLCGREISGGLQAVQTGSDRGDQCARTGLCDIDLHDG